MALEWPPLHRSTPRLVPLSAQLILLDHFLSPPALAVWAAFLQHHVVPRLLPSPPRQPGNAIRTNDRFSIDDPALAMSLWTATGLDRIVCAERRFDVRLASPVGLNSNIRLYRYQKGAVFGKHYDESTRDSYGRASEWTLLLYLTGKEDGVVGGETVFYPTLASKSKRVKRAQEPAEVVVELARGRMVLHRHGAECMLHEGRRVDQGVKWILRSDLMYA